MFSHAQCTQTMLKIVMKSARTHFVHTDNRTDHCIYELSSLNIVSLFFAELVFFSHFQCSIWHLFIKRWFPHMNCVSNVTNISLETSCRLLITRPCVCALFATWSGIYFFCCSFLIRQPSIECVYKYYFFLSSQQLLCLLFFSISLAINCETTLFVCICC